MTRDDFAVIRQAANILFNLEQERGPGSELDARQRECIREVREKLDRLTSTTPQQSGPTPVDQKVLVKFAAAMKARVIDPLIEKEKRRLYGDDYHPKPPQQDGEQSRSTNYEKHVGNSDDIMQECGAKRSECCHNPKACKWG